MHHTPRTTQTCTQSLPRPPPSASPEYRVRAGGRCAGRASFERTGVPARTAAA